MWVLLEDKDLPSRPLLLKCACETFVLLMKPRLEHNSPQAFLERVAGLIGE